MSKPCTRVAEIFLRLSLGVNLANYTKNYILRIFMYVEPKVMTFLESTYKLSFTVIRLVFNMMPYIDDKPFFLLENLICNLNCFSWNNLQNW